MRLHRPATTLYDMTAQALLFESHDKKQRMTAFLEERRHRREARAQRAVAADHPLSPSPETHQEDSP